MTRLALMIAFVCLAAAVAAPVPAGLDPQNTIFLDTKYGRVIIRLRPELAPIPQSSSAELALHDALLADPRRDVADGAIDAIDDADADMDAVRFMADRPEYERLADTLWVRRNSRLVDRTGLTTRLVEWRIR